MNVALTRAKSLLVVVGNANLLQQDGHWSGFIRHCQQLGAVKGAPVKPVSADGDGKLSRVLDFLRNFSLDPGSEEFEEEEVRVAEATTRRLE